MDRNASERYQLYDLPVLRTTSMAALRDCPRRWSLEHAELEIESEIDADEPGNEWTRRGSAVHHACEYVLRGILDPTDAVDWEAEERLLKGAGVSPAERQNAHDYCCELKARMNDTERWRLVAVEARFVRAMIPGAPPVKGTPDVIWMDLDEGCYVIQDHKTNRKWEASDDWRRKLQPRVYAWAIRSGLQRGGPTAPIDFEVGYVNLGGSVRWRTNDGEDAAAVQEIEQLWQELQVYRRTQEWPERINQWCSSCPVMYTCRAAQELLESIGGLSQETLDIEMENAAETPLLERLNWVKAALKIGEALEKRLLDDVRARIECGEGQFREGLWLAHLRPRSKREASFTLTYPDVQQAAAEHDGVDLNAVFSVKLGELDKLTKRIHCLGDYLDEAGAIQTIEQEPSVVVRLARPGE